MNLFTVRLMGTVQLAINQQPIRPFRSQKAQALFAYLITEGKPIPRRHLAQFLWDGYTTKAALINLRQVLTNLRKTLNNAPFLIVSRQAIAIQCNHPALWCDILVLQELLQPEQVLSPQRWQALAPSLDGEFLHDLATVDSAPFQAWRTAKNVFFQQEIAQLNQKIVRGSDSQKWGALSEPVQIWSKRRDDSSNERTFVELSQRFCNPYYPYLTLAHELVVPEQRLSLVHGLCTHAGNAEQQPLQNALRNLAPRPPSVQALLFGSWHALAPDLRTGLVNCSIFSGSFTADAAQAIVHVTVDTLHQLVAHELLQQTWDTAASPAVPRFRLQEQIRAYASLQLPPTLFADLRAHHACYYLEAMSEQPPRGSVEQQSNLHFHADLENIWQAWRCC